MHKKYLKYSFILFLSIMSIIASINFVVDPGEIYLKKIIADKKSSEFTDKLFESKYGIIQTGWNERLIKTTLARQAPKFECVIIGSSHIMSISSIKNTGNITSQCKNLLNLGVSGGGIEDIAIFTNIILKNIELPKIVFIGIAPWTLKFNMDSRYGAYKNQYIQINQLLQFSNKDSSNAYETKYIKNLFNFEYLTYSLTELFENKKITKKESLFDKKILYPKNSFPLYSGYDEAVTLQDGSHVYAKKWIAQQKNENQSMPFGGGDYKLSEVIYDKNTIGYLQKLVDLYKYNDIKIKFILTPYHPNVFKKGDTKAVQSFKVIEEITRRFAQINNIQVYGSYFPRKLGCKESEYYDFMHPNEKCLNRIDFSK